MLRMSRIMYVDARPFFQVGGTPECQELLSKLYTARTAWRAEYTREAAVVLHSFKGSPLLAHVLDHYQPSAQELPQSFWPFIKYLCGNTMRAYPDEPALKKWEKVPSPNDWSNKEEVTAYQENGNMYPYRPRHRPRGYYPGYDHLEEANACRHRFLSHRKKTGGLMSGFCPHSVCQGSHIIVNAEGRKDAYRMLFCRFKEAPAVVIYVSHHTSIPARSMHTV